MFKHYLLLSNILTKNSNEIAFERNQSKLLTITNLISLVFLSDDGLYFIPRIFGSDYDDKRWHPITQYYNNRPPKAYTSIMNNLKKRAWTLERAHLLNNESPLPSCL